MIVGSRRARMLASPQWRGRAFGNTHPATSGFKAGVDWLKRSGQQFNAARVVQ